MNERTAIGGSAGTGRVVRGGAAAEAVKVWRGLPDHQRTAVNRDRLMQMWIKGEILRLTNARASQNMKVGNPGPEGSVAKLTHAELNKELFEFCVNLLGPDGQIDFDYTFRQAAELDVDGASRGVQYAFLRVRANSIEGGTSEIMRNILGEQVLGLPGEPRVDKDLPWSKVPR
jgi:alkylation response protein AidB-like acyl-CoA dehydrogenase